MLELTLIRHAKSSWDEAGLSDFDRPLNDRGRRDAPRMGRRLKELGVHFELMLSSPAQRAIETARLIAAELHYPDYRIRTLESLYNADADTLLEEIQRIESGVRHAALVAHNPGISRLYHLLTGDSVDMPTCTAATLRFDVDDWQGVHMDSGWPKHYEYPKKLKD